ncbi:hypothetical protein [Pelagicoccus mobilis]|uniref:Tetratricopeptide repeat protein n=1 Tax=Pelagicoccus mobilis TaxID=415221 RepID=A0A934VSJ3_9BACT|nr:hypothetical protein [Pelagicoccus mobilis]MBK1878569.1 hypothetical protein [Pelagicoccus mobilis]
MRTTVIFRLVASWGALTGYAWGAANEGDSVSLKLSDELEQAIYLHEGEADLGKAAQAYRGILEESELVDSIAAETSYRLAMVYLDQGKQALAMKLLSDLVENYPEESQWVAEAEAVLPKKFVPEITPWEDGERTYYDWLMPTGDLVGRSFSTIYSYEWEGRELWRKETRFVLNGHRSTAVEFDKKTFNTAYGRMNLEKMGNCRAWYAEDGRSVNVEYSKTGKSSSFDFNQRVYDNEQAVDLMRQIPIELGYRMAKKIFVSFSGMPIDITFEIKSIEELDTALGHLECYEVEIDMQVQKQSVIFTADERRIPVIYKVGGVEAHLTKVETVNFDAPRLYENEKHGFSLEVPAAWSVIPHDKASDESDQVVWLAEPMVRGVYMAASELNTDWKKEEPISIDGMLAEMTGKVRRQFSEIKSDPVELKRFELGGLEAGAFLFEAPEGSQTQGDVYLYILLGEEKHYVFQGAMPPGDTDEMLPIFEKIVMSLKTEL